ncbi:hypothetical protein HHI36_018079 [Cryptolaemus montrouzieri]|uniref:Uncharacterized protein n=1 Tax=Cryptolaemus montrouzieri TaxID=559131 RepID=A0ABD2P069_9CUCU
MNFLTGIFPTMSRFLASNNYLGLEDAINSVLEDEGDNEYHLIIIPLDPATVTDEEGGAEDLCTSKLPNDVQGTLEDIPQWSNSCVEDVEEQSSKWNDSDDETLSSKRIRTSLAQSVLLGILPSFTETYTNFIRLSPAA